MSSYHSIEEAARAIGVSYEAFRKRKAIKDLARSTDYICRGQSHVKLYLLTSYPPEVQQVLGGKPPNKKLLDPSNKESVLMAAWRKVVQIQDEWCRCHKITTAAACDNAFATAVAEGRVRIEDGILSALKWGTTDGISRGSLRRMREKLVAGEARSLDRPKAKAIDERPDLAAYIIAYVHDFAHANITVLRRELVSHFADVPSLSTISRWVESWKAENAATYLKSTNPDKWKNKYMAAFGSQSEDVTQPNQRWELDSSPADIMLTDGRYTVIGVIDVCTRRANLIVSHRSKAEAIISLLRQTIATWGAPQTIKTDNGSDYTSVAMSNACGVLAIWQDLCPPYSPEKKPHIERFLGTFEHDWLPTLPGYIGHNVETRQAIRSQRSFADNRTRPDRTVGLRLTVAEFRALCTNWIEQYNDRPHSALGMDSPNSLWGKTKFFPRQLDLRELDLLLAFQGKRKVLKKGISFDGGTYIAPALVPGDTVQISIDATDMGTIYVFDMLGNYICDAVDPALIAVDRQAIAMEASQRQRAQNAEAGAALRKSKSQSNYRQIRKEILAEQTTEKLVPEPVVEQVARPPKVVELRRTATPEELFERAWGNFEGASHSLSPADWNRVYYSVIQGDSSALLNDRADDQTRDRFLAWLGEFASAAQQRKA
jgi:putative transposase